MSSSLLCAMVRRLLLDRIETTIYSWTVSGDPMNAGMHVHVAAFPYLDVTKISIWQPCLNFSVYSSHMLLHRLHRLDVLLIIRIGVEEVISKKLYPRVWDSLHYSDKSLVSGIWACCCELVW